MFLQTIAKTYIEKYGDNLHHITFIFPNNRAGLFFRKFLCENTSKSLLAPRIVTINSLFADLALRLEKPLRKDEPLQQLFTLYRIYKQHHPDESLDKFIFWGRMLLGDFNEVDQYLIDPQKIFTNVRDLKKLSAFTAEEDKHFRETFFNVFYKAQEDTPEQNEGMVKTAFIDFWDELYGLYKEHTKTTLASGYVQEGLLQRQVVEHLSEITDSEFLSKHYVFIGFNALTKVERSLLTFLKDNVLEPGRVDFLWDYNLPEQLSDNEALQYKHANEKHYPKPADIDIDVKPQIPRIELIQVASGIGQTSVIQHYLHSEEDSSQNIENPKQNIEDSSQNIEKRDWTRTAIVLPDESMLVPTLYAIDSGKERQTDESTLEPTVNTKDSEEEKLPVNVTMGYSMTLTSIFTLIKHLAQLQQTIRNRGEEVLFYHKPVLAILHALNSNGIYDSYIREIINTNKTYIDELFFAEDNFLHIVFQRNNNALDALNYVENIVARLKNFYKNKFESEPLQLVEQKLNLVRDLWTEDLTADANVFYRLLTEILSGLNMPFEGEPLSGLQVMGVLETRALDFDDVFILSVNEDVFPKHNSNNSFIPAELRKYFDLPLTENKDGIFAYNFYRMLFHAKNVYLIQNTLSSELTSGEVSRYVHQLTYLYFNQIKIVNKDASFGEMNARETTPLVIPKTGLVKSQLDAYLRNGISPSAIKDYVNCPLLFYLNDVLRLQDKSIEEDLQPNELGTVVHSALERLYNNKIGTIHAKDIDEFMQSIKQSEFLEKIYLNKKFNEETESKFSLLEGRDKIYIEVVRQFVMAVLEHEREICATHTISNVLCEYPVECYPFGENKKNIKLKGTIDYIDLMDGKSYRLIDYKTGASKCKFESVESLFSSTDAANALQTMLYAYMLKHKNKKQGENAIGSQNFSLPIVPHIYSVKEMIASKQMCKTSILPTDTSFDTFEVEFTEFLLNILQEISNEEISFAKPENHQEKDCKFCGFKAICGVKEKSY